MKLKDIYKYSWFANLAYVIWDGSEIGYTEDQGINAIASARAARRIPGDEHGTGATLGERIFLDPSANGGGLGWRLINYSDLNSPATASTGFSASLFENQVSHEKVLAIRGTNPVDDLPKQLLLDLVGADIGQIGIIGMALSQTISMVNYVT